MTAGAIRIADEAPVGSNWRCLFFSFFCFATYDTEFLAASDWVSDCGGEKGKKTTNPGVAGEHLVVQYVSAVADSVECVDRDRADKSFLD